MKHAKIFGAILATVFTATLFASCGEGFGAIAVFERDEDSGTALASASSIYYFFEDGTWELTAKGKSGLATKEFPAIGGTYECITGDITGEATLSVVKTKEADMDEWSSSIISILFSKPKLKELSYEDYKTYTFTCTSTTLYQDLYNTGAYTRKK